MFITSAHAQSPDGGILGGLGMIGPLILIFVIMYFLVIRPQRMQLKKQQDMVNATRRGDTVVTAGGLIGKVTRVFDESNEIEVEIAEDVRVRVVRSTLANVRVKGEVAKENSAGQDSARRKTTTTKSRTAANPSQAIKHKKAADTQIETKEADTSTPEKADAPVSESDK